MTGPVPVPPRTPPRTPPGTPPTTPPSTPSSIPRGSPKSLPVALPNWSSGRTPASGWTLAVSCGWGVSIGAVNSGFGLFSVTGLGVSGFACSCWRGLPFGKGGGGGGGGSKKTTRRSPWSGSSSGMKIGTKTTTRDDEDVGPTNEMRSPMRWRRVLGWGWDDDEGPSAKRWSAVDGPEVAARSRSSCVAPVITVILAPGPRGGAATAKPAALVVAAGASPDTVDAQCLRGVPPGA